MQAAAQAAAYAAGVGSVDGTLPSAPPSVDGSLLGRAASIRMQHSSGGSLVMPYMCACSPQIAASIIVQLQPALLLLSALRTEAYYSTRSPGRGIAFASSPLEACDGAVAPWPRTCKLPGPMPLVLSSSAPLCPLPALTASL